MKRAAIALGFIEEETVTRSATPELPIAGSPYSGLNASNLSNAAGTAVSTERAVGLSGVFRAVSIISTSISQLELGVWRSGIELPQPSTSLVAQPNITMPLSAFLEQTVMSLALTGNAYWLLNKSGPSAAVQNITVLDPNITRIEYDDNGKKWYWEGDNRYPAWRIQHLWNVRLPGYGTGVGPIQVCQNELRGALNLRNYADNWFTDTKQPNYYLKTDQTLSGQMLSEYGDAWSATLARGGVPVVGAGMTLVPFAMNPADAQFLENQNFSLTQIARMFGVPGILMDLASGDSMTYSNREDVINDFYRFTLKKYMTEIESAFSALLVRGQVAKFRADTLLGMVPEGDLADPTPDAPVNANSNQDGNTNG